MNKLLLVIVCCFAAEVAAQAPAKKDDRVKGNLLQVVPPAEKQQEEVRAIFGELEKHIAEGAARPLAGLVGGQVFIDVTGGEHGYFSSNQALSVLQSFFVQRKPLSFKFSSVNQRAPSPYATGRLTYLHKGNRESAQVYVALTRRDSLWVMTQFNIY